MSGSPRRGDPNRAGRLDGVGAPTDGDRREPEPAQGDTFAWLLAAFQVLAPVVLLLAAVAAAGYALLWLAFLR